jgi:hypothetical protein
MQEAIVDGKIDVTCGWIKTTGIEVILGGREGGEKRQQQPTRSFPDVKLMLVFYSSSH